MGSDMELCFNVRTFFYGIYPVEDILKDDHVRCIIGVIKLFEGLSILLRGGLEGLPLILMEFLRV